MTIEEIKQFLLVNSFQYFIGEDEIEVTDEVLPQLIKKALMVYGNWRPFLVEEKIEITDYDTPLKFDSEGRRILGIGNLYLIQPILAGEDGKIDWDWSYRKDAGIIEAQVLGKYYAELLVMPRLEDLDESHTEFLDLLLGLYLMYIGSSRKSFTFNDAPFENDGADIYSDGKELYENALNSLQNEQDNWYLAII